MSTAKGLYRRVQRAFAAPYLHEVEAGVTASPYLGASALGAEFVDTRGFSIACRRSALGTVFDEFPYLRPFLDRAIFPSSNAFYINPLIMAAGSRVDPHVDCRAVESERVRIVPTLVSVLYVRCPAASAGGALRFRPDTEGEVKLRPGAGDLVHFRGDLLHAVAPLWGDAIGTRMSVVCEQYNLASGTPLSFPELTVIRGG